jgi:hypothetical protein
MKTLPDKGVIIRCVTTDQKVVGSTPAERTISFNRIIFLSGVEGFLLMPCVPILGLNNGGVVVKFGGHL